MYDRRFSVQGLLDTTSVQTLPQETSAGMRHALSPETYMCNKLARFGSP